MTFVPRILEPQVNWNADTVADPASWTIKLTRSDHLELDHALKTAKASSKNLYDISRNDFPLDNLAAKLRKIEIELIDGRGFVLISSLNTHSYSDDELTMLYWGIGTYLGNPMSQDKYGLFMGDIIARYDPHDPLARLNSYGPIAYEYHSDSADLVGLMCLQNAKSGGISCIANAVAIHNELVRTRPDLLVALYEALPYDLRDQQKPGFKPYGMVPCFTEYQGRLFSHFFSILIYKSQRHAQAPRLSPKTLEALDELLKMARDPRFNVYMNLQPGDIQFLNNYHIFHARTAYVDEPEIGHRRHLKRLWLTSRYLESAPEYFYRTI
ncbi:MAG: TauD/TfdA family dioxygenase [Legionella sp.]|uniref:TauD/TfdA family dioxygenase n=1 Tax=Legionella sp. TaxID=459 RepID=UPI0039E219C3